MVVKCAVMSHWMRLISPGDTRTLLHRTIIATIYIRERWWPLFILTLLPCPPLTDWHEYWATTITAVHIHTTSGLQGYNLWDTGSRSITWELSGRPTTLDGSLAVVARPNGWLPCPVPSHPRETHREIGRRFMDDQQAAQGHFTHSLGTERDGRALMDICYRPTNDRGRNQGPHWPKW